MSDFADAGRQRTQSIVDMADAVTVQRFLDGVRAMTTKRDPFECSEEAVHVTCDVLKCDRASMFYIDEEADELVLFVARGSASIRLPVGKGIAGQVAKDSVLINIADAYLDERFDRRHDLETGYRTQSILCAPVADADGRTVGVLQAINKLGGGAFTKVDEILMFNLVGHVGVALRNAQMFEEARESTERLQSLVEVIRLLHSDPNPASLMFTLARRAHELVGADRGTLYLVDSARKELVVMGGDLEFRLPLSVGIAGEVASTGTVVNIPDAYDDDRFSQDLDKKSGYRTRQILALPIRAKEDGAVIGVIQAINKDTDSVFTDADVELLTTLMSIAGPIVEQSDVLAALSSKRRSIKGDSNEALVPALGSAPSPALQRPQSLPSLHEEEDEKGE